MKLRSRRLMALLLSAAMVVPMQGTIYGGETAGETAALAQTQLAEETQAPAEPQTQAPAEPQTQAPTEPQTQAPAEPQTQAPTEPQTQAPTEPQTQAPTEPQTQAPTEPQTQAPAEPQTQAPTEPQTQAPTEPQTQAPTESQTQAPTEAQSFESETEKTVSTFQASADGVSVEVTLPDGIKLPESTVFKLKRKNQGAVKKTAAALEEGHKALSGTVALTLTVKDAKGADVQLPKGTSLRFSFDGGLDLSLAERGEGEIHFLRMNDSANEAGADLSFSEDGTKLTAASLKLKKKVAGSVTYAAAGLQNRQNDGEEADAEKLTELEGASGLAVAAGEYDGPDKGAVLTRSDDPQKDAALDGALKALGEYSLTLADAMSSDEVRVVNLYADEKGEVSTESKKLTDPLYGIVGEDGSINVTDGYVVVNVVAQSADEALKLPDFTVTYTKDNETKAVTEDGYRKYAGRLLVNLVAENPSSGDAYVPYTGTAEADDAEGTYLAPAGTLEFAGDLTGSAYAEKVSIAGDFTPATITEKGKKKDLDQALEKVMGLYAAEEAETGAETEAAAEAETAAEGSTEAAAAKPARIDEEAEIAEEQNAEGGNTADADTYQGTLSVSAQSKATAEGGTEQTTALSNVVFSLYEKQDDGSLKMVYSFASAEAAETIPSGILKVGKSYVLREEVLPVAADGKTYGKLGGAEFSINRSDVGDVSIIPATLAAGIAFGDGTFTFTHTESETPAGTNAVTINVMDPGKTPIAGSNIRIQQGTDPNWTDVAEFTMPEGSVSYDFTELLNASESESSPTEGDFKTFRITETAPEGMYGQESTVLTYTYGTLQPEEGQEGEVLADQKGWTLTRTSVAADGSTDDGPVSGEKAKVVTFTDAYQIDLTSVQVKYADDTVLNEHLSGGSIQKISDGSKDFHYIVLEADSDGKYVAVKTEGGYVFNDKTVRLVLTDAGAGDVTITGSRSDGYHFTGSVNAALAVPVKNEKGFYSAKVPAATLKSRAAATVTVTSKLKLGDRDESDHTGKEVTANVAGTPVNFAENPSTLTFNSSDKDAAVAAMLQGDTKQITCGSTNKQGYTYDGSYAELTAYSEDNAGAKIEATLYSKKVEKYGTVNVSVQFRNAKGRRINTINKQTIYAALFDVNGVRVTEVKPIVVNAHNHSSSSTAAKFVVPVDAAAGQSVYYVREVADENGTPYKDDNVVVSYNGQVESDGKITLKVRKEGSVDNTFARILKNYKVPNPDPENPMFEGNGTFGIEVRVVDYQGNPVKVQDLVASFKVGGVINGKNMKLNKQKKVSLKDASKANATGISFPVAGKTTPMSVTLMSIKDSSGKSLSKQYTLLTASSDNGFSRAGKKTGERTFNLVGTQDNQGPVVFVLRQNDTNEKAVLTLTKSVMYKKTPIRVNATYYIGIFSDPGHKKLLFKKAMTLLDASSMSDTLKVNINSQKNHQITLYFAETDRKGRVVTSGKKTGYDISISQESVTLSPQNMNATVTVTNEILDGTKASERLTDPNSGFAGDTEALGEAQSLASSSNLGGSGGSGSGKTGDSTPLGMYLIAVLAAGAAAAALLLVLRKKRRRS